MWQWRKGNQNHLLKWEEQQENRLLVAESGSDFLDDTLSSLTRGYHYVTIVIGSHRRKWFIDDSYSLLWFHFQSHLELTTQLSTSIERRRQKAAIENRMKFFSTQFSLFWIIYFDKITLYLAPLLYNWLQEVEVHVNTVCCTIMHPSDII